MTVSPPGPAVGQVFDLRYGSHGHSSSAGLFATAEGAMAHAATIHRSYLAMQDELSADEREDTEEVYAELTWNVEQLYATSRRRVPLGDPVPVAHYSESSSFHLRTVPVYA